MAWEHRTLGGECGWEGNEWAHSQLEIVEGEPQFFDSFKRNIAHHGFSEQVRILRCPTQFSSGYLKSGWADADMAYIDADHAFNSVYRDLCLIKNSCPHALICGDDWRARGVKLAVSFFAIRRGLQVFIDYNSINTQWVLIDRTNKNSKAVVLTKGWHSAKPIMTHLNWLRFRLWRNFLKKITLRK